MKKKSRNRPPESETGRAPYRVRGHIWIEGREGTFLGMGRVALLEKIRESGSITGAARSLKMSYRRAWELVESMNMQAPSPLVIASTGGRGGGGAAVTEAGERAIRAFKKMDEGFRRFREREAEKIAVLKG